MDDREDGLQARNALLDAVKELKEQHPWHYLVGPMSSAERKWYDLKHPDRTKV